MRRNFKRNADYTDNTSSFYNTENIIPGQNITMKNTGIPLMGQGLDSNGFPIGEPQFMQPGFNYNYPQAVEVKETPIFQEGGAYNQYTNPMSQNYMNYPNQVTDLGTAVTNPFAYQVNQAMYSTPGAFSDPLTGQVKFNTNVNPSYLQEEVVNEPIPTTVPAEDTRDFQFFNPYVGSDLGSASFNLGQSIKDKDTVGTIGSGLKLGAGLARNFFSGMGVQNRENQIEADYYKKQREGLTQANRPTYMQEGGEVQNEQQEVMQVVAEMLQQGMAPEEIVAGLVQNGIDEATAQQIVQAVMQQMQGAQPIAEQEQPVMRDGGAFLNTLKGKRIVDYKLNSDTNEYEVTYE